MKSPISRLTMKLPTFLRVVGKWWNGPQNSLLINCFFALHEPVSRTFFAPDMLEIFLLSVWERELLLQCCNWNLKLDYNFLCLGFQKVTLAIKWHIQQNMCDFRLSRNWMYMSRIYRMCHHIDLYVYVCQTTRRHRPENQIWRICFSQTVKRYFCLRDVIHRVRLIVVLLSILRIWRTMET